MFGLGDKDQNANYTNGYNAGVATQPMPEYQNTSAPSQLPNNSMPGYDPANTAPALDPASIPSAPPMASGPDTVPLIPHPAAASPPSEPSQAPSLPHTSSPTVSLEHAYITTDPPNMEHKETDVTAKPSAASLFTTNTDDLVKMKQQALQNLEPLIDKLEQTPEEKFRTTMMLIQASDNSDLLKDAYDSANAIKDEKARAQALLDVVNEINYFTQQAQASTHPAAPTTQIL
jgi:hypothetical protein